MHAVLWITIITSTNEWEMKQIRFTIIICHTKFRAIMFVILNVAPQKWKMNQFGLIILLPQLNFFSIMKDFRIHN